MKKTSVSKLSAHAKIVRAAHLRLASLTLTFDDLQDLLGDEAITIVGVRDLQAAGREDEAPPWA